MAEASKVKNQDAQDSTGLSFPLPSPVQRLGEYPRRFRQFLHEVRVEMRHVTWPTITDVRGTTFVVIVTVFFFGFFLFLVDFGVSHVVERVLKIFKH